jgi:hypothetical protein
VYSSLTKATPTEEIPKQKAEKNTPKEVMATGDLRDKVYFGMIKNGWLTFDPIRSDEMAHVATDNSMIEQNCPIRRG